MPRAARRSLGFTLLELAVAMAVALLLVCLSVMGYARFMESTAIDGGVSMVDDVFTEARQDAVTQNNTVEVRLYAAGVGSGYDALQLHWHDADGTTPAIAPVVLLPQAAVIDASSAHLALATTHPDAPTSDASDPRFTASTLCFHFLPDGSTDLAAPGVVTIRAAAQSDPARFPANWACVEIDPLTGRAQVYRP